MGNIVLLPCIAGAKSAVQTMCSTPTEEGLYITRAAHSQVWGVTSMNSEDKNPNIDLVTENIKWRGQKGDKENLLDQRGIQYNLK